MRIAQVAPLYESVPPKAYGGSERVVSYLTEELVRLGHDVTLFASGDSETHATLVPMCATSLRLDPQCIDSLCYHVVEIDTVLERAEEFDVVHFHTDYLHFAASRHCRVPHVTTLHGRLDIRDLVPLYQRFTEVPVVSISDSQRRPLPQANWQATVYHGLPRDLHMFHSTDKGYLAFLGRISPEKRVDRAIEIAKRTGMPLKIAAKVDKADEEYYERSIRGLIDSPGIEFIGEIGEREKDDFLGNAAAMLFPIDWPEPFGMVMIEALACGTPVIAWCCGSVPEVIIDGVGGFLCESIDEAVRGVQRIKSLSRARCRKEFENRFLARQMAENYVQVYGKLIDASHQERKVAHAGDHRSPRRVLHSEQGRAPQ
jgi:glycosyltransferase involved in cell wall biosynthesis